MEKMEEFAKVLEDASTDSAEAVDAFQHAIAMTRGTFSLDPSVAPTVAGMPRVVVEAVVKAREQMIKLEGDSALREPMQDEATLLDRAKDALGEKE